MKIRYFTLFHLPIYFMLQGFGAFGQTDNLTVYTTALSERIANYTLDVRLDVGQKIIRGKMQLSWTNRTSFPATDLQFHLYYNAWRNNRSSFINSVRFRSRKLQRYKDDEWAYCDIKTIQILKDENFENEDVFSALEFIQPDDGNPHDRTALRVPLRRSVFPGETIRLEITWDSKAPRTFARTGAIGDYFFLAQWFPKIAVFEDNGLWNCHQFIQTEFYADYGVYDVKLTVPSGWTVGATGREIARTENPDRTTTHHYYQEDVHDFTWVTSPLLTAHTARFNEPGLLPVDMRLLLMPDHAAMRERYFTATEIALKYYGQWFGAYPYGHVTVVDPAFQSMSGGMEYPTLFTGGTRWLSPPETRSPESVTIHEAGHQFWYGIIGNNEFEHAWLDEGFNTYSQNRIFMNHFPKPVLTKRYLENFLPLVFSDVYLENRTAGADKYAGFHSVFKKDAIAADSWAYGPDSYGPNSYDRPAMMLHTLENYLGWETFQKVMSTFFERWKFKHPRPEHFFSIVNEISGQDMTWFFQEAYYTANVFDYGVDSVWSEAARKFRGYRDGAGEAVFHNSASAPPAEMDDDHIISTVYIRRWGEAVFPVDIKFTFENGEEVWERWDGRDRWKAFVYRKPAYLKQVEVDPEHKLVLDVNYANNSWMRSSQENIAAWKWASKWMIWVQSFMEFCAFFI